MEALSQYSDPEEEEEEEPSERTENKEEEEEEKVVQKTTAEGPEESKVDLFKSWSTAEGELVLNRIYIFLIIIIIFHVKSMISYI